MRSVHALILCMFLVPCAGAAAPEDPNGSGQYVSREEYEMLKKELEELKAKFAAIEAKTESAAQDQKEKVEAIDQKLAKVEAVAEGSGLGTTKMLIAGDAAVGYTDQEETNSTFGAEWSPLFLWQLTDRLFFEGGLDLSLTGPDKDGKDSGTEADLGSAYLSYLINDWAVLGIGFFPLQFTAYHNHFDAPWINKLPTDPLVYGDDGIAPDSSVGVFATGAFERGRSVINYAAWVTNGPSLITEDPESAGSLNFDDFNDTNYNKAAGFRLGYLPIPELEVGYSFEYSRPSPDGFKTLDSRLHGIDWNYVSELKPIKGRLTARGGWVWSLLDEATYDPCGKFGFGPLRFDNDRNGGYAEIAYRPTQSKERLLQNLEFVVRYDRLDIPAEAPGGGTHDQWTPGITYWLTPRTALKLAYAFDDHDNGEDLSGLFFQFATGF